MIMHPSAGRTMLRVRESLHPGQSNFILRLGIPARSTNHFPLSPLVPRKRAKQVLRAFGLRMTCSGSWTVRKEEERRVLKSSRWREGRHRNASFRFWCKVLTRIDEAVPLEVVLFVIELLIAPVCDEQLVVRSPLHDLSTLEHQNLVSASYRR